MEKIRAKLMEKFRAKMVEKIWAKMVEKIRAKFLSPKTSPRLVLKSPWFWPLILIGQLIRGRNFQIGLRPNLDQVLDSPPC